MAYLEYKPHGTLHHYTTEEGFLGIIESKKIWLSDLKTSNDPRELTFGIDRITPKIYKILSGCSAEKYIYIRRLLSKTLSYFKHSRLYSASFSTKGDDINMWRNYSNNGEGICIGFRPRSITDMAGRLQKIEYVATDIDSDIDLIIQDMLKPIIYAKDINILSADSEIDISSNLITLLSRMKHHTWRYEDEVRLVFASEIANSPDVQSIPVATLPSGKPVPWAPAKSRIRNDSIVFYYEHSFGKEISGKHDPSESIDRISIGPNCTMSEQEAEFLLRRNSFKRFKIERSECRFR